jgi:hypothetical protein
MTARQRLPNRRPSETFELECGGLKYRATISRYDDGRLSEIFLGNAKAGSQSDTNAKDAAVIRTAVRPRLRRLVARMARQAANETRRNRPGRLASALFGRAI